MLVLSMHLPPENVPCSVQAGQILRFLKDDGIETRGLATTLSPISGLVPDAPQPDVVRIPEQPESLRRSFRLENLAAYFLRLGEYGNSWTKHAVDAAVQMLEREEFMGIVTISPPFASHMAGLELKRRFPHLLWVADFMDPYVDNPFRPANPIWDRIARRREREVFASADALLSNTSTVADLWRNRFPECRDKTSVVWSGYDLDEHVPWIDTSDRPGPRFLSHVGTLYAGRTPCMVTDSMERLFHRGLLRPEDMQLSLIGDTGPEILALPNYRRMEDRGFVRAFGKVERDESLVRMAESDYLLLLDLNVKDTTLQVPSKLFDYIRTGKPILCATVKDSPTAHILARSGIPHRFFFTSSSPEDLDRALLELLQISPAPTRATDWFWDTFDARKQIRRVSDLFLGKRTDDPAMVANVAVPVRSTSQVSAGNTP